MPFQVGIGSLGGTVFSGGTLYPSANYMLGQQFFGVQTVENAKISKKILISFFGVK